MITATIEPRPDGTALVEVDGRVQMFTTFWSALAEVRACGMTVRVERFPTPALDVVAVAPALRISS